MIQTVDIDGAAVLLRQLKTGDTGIVNGHPTPLWTLHSHHTPEEMIEESMVTEKNHVIVRIGMSL